MKVWLLGATVALAVTLVVGLGYFLKVSLNEPLSIPKEQVERYIKGDESGIAPGMLKLFKAVRREIVADFEDPEATLAKIENLQGKPIENLTSEEQIYIYMSEAMIGESLSSFGEVLDGFKAEADAEENQFNVGLTVPLDYPAEKPANVARIDQVNDLEFEGYISDPENYFQECFKLLPEGTTDFGLTIAIQSGVYDLFVQANPGEAGKLGIKAVETIRNRPVALRVVDNSNPHSFQDDEKEEVRYEFQWSDNKQQLFKNIYELTILDGKRGFPFPARFEIWFYPSDGGAERKLMEKTFLIEGWNS